MSPSGSSRSLANAIEAPSGDQAGQVSSAGPVSSEPGPEPSAFIVHRSWSPPVLRANTRRRPSGDHAGCDSVAVSRVSRRRPVPSAAITYRSPCGSSRVDTNAIRVPSGENAGSSSVDGSRVSRREGGGAAVTGGPTRRVNSSRFWSLVNAIRPGGGAAGAGGGAGVVVDGGAGCARTAAGRGTTSTAVAATASAASQAYRPRPGRPRTRSPTLAHIRRSHPVTPRSPVAPTQRQAAAPRRAP